MYFSMCDVSAKHRAWKERGLFADLHDRIKAMGMSIAEDSSDEWATDSDVGDGENAVAVMPLHLHTHHQWDSPYSHTHNSPSQYSASVISKHLSPSEDMSEYGASSMKVQVDKYEFESKNGRSLIMDDLTSVTASDVVGVMTHPHK